MADDRQAALNAIDLKGNIVLKEFGEPSGAMGAVRAAMNGTI